MGEVVSKDGHNNGNVITIVVRMPPGDSLWAKLSRLGARSLLFADEMRLYQEALREITAATREDFEDALNHVIAGPKEDPFSDCDCEVCGDCLHCQGGNFPHAVMQLIQLVHLNREIFPWAE